MTRLTRHVAVNLQRYRERDNLSVATVAATTGTTLQEIEDLEAGTTIPSVETLVHLDTVFRPFYPDWIAEHLDECMRYGRRPEHTKGPGRDEYLIRSDPNLDLDVLALIPEQVAGTACLICADSLAGEPRVLRTRSWVSAAITQTDCRKYPDHENYLYQHRDCRFLTLPCGCPTSQLADTTDLVFLTCPRCEHRETLTVHLRGTPLPAELTWRTCPACGHSTAAINAASQVQ